MTRHFFSVISRPTRITKFSATLIDNIFVIVTSCSLTNTIIYYDVSDHLPIFLQADISGKTCKQSADLRKKRFFKQESVTKFVNQVSTIDWSEFNGACITNNDTNALSNSFQNVFSEAFNKYFPLCNITNSNLKRHVPVWLSQSLLKSCKKKSVLYKRYLKSKSKESKNKLLAYRNKLKTLLKAAEK